MRASRILSLALPLLLTPPLPAQQLLVEVAGFGPGSAFGYSVAGVGDIDADGVPDLFVGAPREDHANGILAGAVRFLSGADGSVLHERFGDGFVDQLGWSVAALGDVDGDGVPDAAASARGGPSGDHRGYVRLFSGADGSAIVTLSVADDRWYDAQVACAGDVNADGHTDVVVGDRGENCAGIESGSVRVYSGLGWGLLYTLCGTGPHQNFGQAVAGIGDLNQDGMDDFAVGAPNAHGGDSFSGVVTVRSGADGSVLLTIPGAKPFGRLGWYLDGVGDVDGDGLPDLAIAEAGSTFVVSGTGAVLHAIQCPNATVSARVAGVGDVDGDGVNDLASGFPGLDFGAGEVWVHSGASGELVFGVHGSGTSFYGSSIDAAGDLDGDGLADFVVGGEGDFTEDDPGGVFAFAGGPSWIARYCTANPNSTDVAATIVAAGTTSVSANDLVLGAGPIPDHQLGLFYYGPDAAQVPFGNGFRCIGGGFFRLGPPLAPSFSWVSRSLDLDAPPASAGPGAILPGSTWRFQFWYRDPSGGGAGFNLSDALALQFLP